jgi:lysozyme family protein
MVNMAQLKFDNANRWQSATPTRNFVSVANSLVADAAKAQYVTVQNYTGVPWFVIAVIHEREAAQRWDASIAQGDPWNAVSTHTPTGRGPFQSWMAAALDSLINCHPYAASNKDWSVGGTLTLLEQYNGLGYAAKDLPSPYIWSGTDQYKSGKFVADHVFRADVIDVQLGCAGLLMAMANLDPSIKLGDTVPVVPLPLPQAPDVVASSSAPKPIWGAWVKSWFT